MPAAAEAESEAPLVPGEPRGLCREAAGGGASVGVAEAPQRPRSSGGISERVLVGAEACETARPARVTTARHSTQRTTSSRSGSIRSSTSGEWAEVLAGPLASAARSVDLSVTLKALLRSIEKNRVAAILSTSAHGMRRYQTVN